MALPDPGLATLPPKPGGTPPIAPASAATLDTSPAADAGPSKPSTTCALCAEEAKYTCPRCSMRTCSVKCIRKHKDDTGCSGQRDPAAFVPLNKFTQGTWDGDYAWLESGRRKIAEWGEGLSADEVASVGGGPPARGGAAAGRGGRGGRGAGRGGAAGNRKSKLDGLRWAISEIGAEVDILPDGMQKRKLNQSSWNPKTRALFLTVQLSIPGPLLGSEQSAQVTTLPRVQVLPQQAASKTAMSLLPESLRDRNDLVLVLPYHIPRRRRDLTVSQSAARRFFPPINRATPLDSALKGTAWIEIPVIQVYEEGEWKRALDAGEVEIMPLLETKRRAGVELTGSERQGKRLRTSDDAPRSEENPDDSLESKGDKALALGLGDYGSGEDNDDKEGDEEEDDDEEGGDVVLSPAMAEALSKALVNDFGEVA